MEKSQLAMTGQELYARSATIVATLLGNVQQR